MKHKKWIFSILILILVQAACNLPQAAPALTPPSLPTVIETATALPAPATAPVSTDLPPAAAATPAATSTPVPTPTLTLSPSPTLTETANPAKLFSDIKLSTQVLSLSCEPKAVRFEVTPANPKIANVVLFIRLRYKISGDRTDWNDGFAMKPFNGGFYYDLNAGGIPYFNKFKEPVAWVLYQFAATDQSGAVIDRSEVFTDKLTLSALCP
ncbi:MAG: hypothetical protein NT121_13575 [Chloroflexi bacterium]|nr:hypothetical protein [Chloroflexota bacterium]